MSGVSLSIIVASSGRPTLTQTLATITPQMIPGDELILAIDNSGDWGHTARNRAIYQARGDYLLHMDDDDIYRHGAFAKIRAALADNPGRPHLFGLYCHPIPPRKSECILPGELKLIEGNVGTQMFVHPNKPETFGVWVSRYGGDYDFIAATVAKFPEGSLVWRREVIAEWRPS